MSKHLRIAAVAACAALSISWGARGRTRDAYQRAAIGAAHWIEENGSNRGNGIVWPADPRNPESVNTTLYAGTPGPILFFLEAYRYTQDLDFLEKGEKGADALLVSISEKDGTGLYEGLAGSGFTLGEAYLITHDTRYRDGALLCVRWLEKRAQMTPTGAKWNDVTDIIAGSSGTGLFLLWAADHLQAPGAKQLAARAGDFLIATAQRKQDGLMWMMDPSYPREMPNFSHGTAGVSYFLATLYQATGQKKFLDAALAGAKYLLSIADLNDRYCMIYHDSEHQDLFYLGWCHGPAGTARLFYRLYQATGDRQWRDLVEKCAEAVVANGGPAKAVTPGVWHNVSMCCGIAAESEFLYDAFLVTHDRRWFRAAKKGSEQLLELAEEDGKRYRWVQVETRVRPDIAVAQTGYMQGASGIGMWLLHFSDALAGGHRPVLTFPDNPFAY